MTYSKWAVKLLGVICFFSSTLVAQITTGTISGTVSDSSGATIPGTNIVILNEETGVARTVQTDAAGRYTAPQLGLGRYHLTASREGFQSQGRSGVELTVGGGAVVNFELPVGAVSEKVEVTGEAPLVQTTESTLSYLVNDRTIRDLPLNGRDISQLILLNPGVIENHNGKWGAADKGYGKRFSISGMRGEDNSYLLDGSYINDFYRHLPSSPTGALTGVETVREFQMLTASFSAAYGRALGGVFNAVTKSGTNEWHGDVYEFLRNSALDARSFFDIGSGPPPFRQNQFGATAGGPIRHDKIFFFAAYEALRESLSQTGIAIVPDLNTRQGILPNGTVMGLAPAIAPFIKRFPLPSPGGRVFGDGTAQYIFAASQPSREDFGQGRIDYQISANDSLFGRFTAANSNGNSFNRYPDAFTVNLMVTRLLTLSETHVISPRLLNSFRFAINRVAPGKGQIVGAGGADVVSVPGQGPAGIDPGSGITPMTGVDQPGAKLVTNRFDTNDDVNLTLGSHSVQLGGMLERLQYSPISPFYPYAEWRFPTLPNLFQGIPDRIRGTPPQLGNFEHGMRQWFPALYVQDDWRATARLTLNLGLRWEPYSVPTEVNGLLETQRKVTDAAMTVGEPWWKNQSWRNFSPRAGFAWSPFQSGKTSVRGGFGLFFVPIDPAVYLIAVVQSPDFSPTYQVNNPVGFPNALAAIAASKAVAGSQDLFSVSYDHFKSPHALQYSFSVQQQIGANNVVTIGYSGRRGLDLSSLSNYNLPQFTWDGSSLALPPGTVTVPNAGYHNINLVSDNTDSWYHGVSVTVQRRFTAGFQGQFSYTYAKAMSETDGSDMGNHVSAGGGGLKVPALPRTNKGLSGYHLGNVLTANYSYDLPFGKGRNGLAGHALSGWQLTGIASFQSGQPFSVTAIAPTALSNYFTDVSPNAVPGFKSSDIIRGDPNQYFNFAAFAPPGPRQLGNLGRNTLLGPGLREWDFGVAKNTAIGERLNLQFRAEAFNITNHTNLGSPGQVGNAGTRGEIFNRTGAPILSASTINVVATSPRQIQFGLKLVF